MAEAPRKKKKQEKTTTTTQNGGGSNVFTEYNGQGMMWNPEQGKGTLNQTVTIGEDSATRQKREQERKNEAIDKAVAEGLEKSKEQAEAERQKRVEEARIQEAKKKAQEEIRKGDASKGGTTAEEVTGKAQITVKPNTPKKKEEPKKDNKPRIEKLNSIQSDAKVTGDSAPKTPELSDDIEIPESEVDIEEGAIPETKVEVPPLAPRPPKLDDNIEEPEDLEIEEETIPQTELPGVEKMRYPKQEIAKADTTSQATTTPKTNLAPRRPSAPLNLNINWWNLEDQTPIPQGGGIETPKSASSSAQAAVNLAPKQKSTPTGGSLHNYSPAEYDDNEPIERGTPIQTPNSVESKSSGSSANLASRSFESPSKAVVDTIPWWDVLEGERLSKSQGDIIAPKGVSGTNPGNNPPLAPRPPRENIEMHYIDDEEDEELQMPQRDIDMPKGVTSPKSKANPALAPRQASNEREDQNPGSLQSSQPIAGKGGQVAEPDSDESLYNDPNRIRSIIGEGGTRVEVEYADGRKEYIYPGQGVGIHWNAKEHKFEKDDSGDIVFSDGKTYKWSEWNKKDNNMAKNYRYKNGDLIDTGDDTPKPMDGYVLTEHGYEEIEKVKAREAAKAKGNGSKTNDVEDTLAQQAATAIINGKANPTPYQEEKTVDRTTPRVRPVVVEEKDVEVKSAEGETPVVEEKTVEVVPAESNEREQNEESTSVEEENKADETQKEGEGEKAEEETEDNKSKADTTTTSEGEKTKSDTTSTDEEDPYAKAVHDANEARAKAFDDYMLNIGEEYQRQREEMEAQDRANAEAAKWTGYAELGAGLANLLAVGEGHANSQVYHSYSQDWMTKADRDIREHRKRKADMADTLERLKLQKAELLAANSLAEAKAAADARDRAEKKARQDEEDAYKRADWKRRGYYRDPNTGEVVYDETKDIYKKQTEEATKKEQNFRREMAGLKANSPSNRPISGDRLPVRIDDKDETLVISRESYARGLNTARSAIIKDLMEMSGFQGTPEEFVAAVKEPDEKGWLFFKKKGLNDYAEYKGVIDALESGEKEAAELVRDFYEKHIDQMNNTSKHLRKNASAVIDQDGKETILKKDEEENKLTGTWEDDFND